MSLSNLQKELRSFSNKGKAKILSGFFKTGKGEYGENDKFLGVVVPQARKIVRKYRDLFWNEIKVLIKSKYHEERLIALLILIEQYNRSDQLNKRKIFKFYLDNTKYINNWDLVDLSAPHIIGGYLSDKDKDQLYQLAKSDNIWERRIAIISTFHFIRNKMAEETLKIAKILLYDNHDLIHKAVGWMLREVGKRISREKEEEFLKKYAPEMPRTMLRYAIEHFPESIRQQYLKRQ